MPGPLPQPNSKNPLKYYRADNGKNLLDQALYNKQAAEGINKSDYQMKVDNFINNPSFFTYGQVPMIPRNVEYEHDPENIDLVALRVVP